jgi:sulfide dehydrogenase cytochrome subunit
MRIPFALAALALCAALVSAAAGAQTPPPGRLLASGCFQCHGTNGVISSGFGTLAGVSATDMMNKLDDMRRKAPRSSIMVPHARGYTTEQLQAIAKYFAAQPKP